MKFPSKSFLLILGLSLLAGSVLAVDGQPDRQAIVTPITGEPTTIHPGLAPTGSAGVCQVGNPNPLAFAITDWVRGSEKYKYMFYADPAQCTACADGFTVESVSLALQFGVEDVKSEFVARVDLEEAVWDETLQCWYPGPEICVSWDYFVIIDTPGLYNITLPIDPACACAQFGYWYGISFEFPYSFTSGMEPDIVTDEFPVGCTSWNDAGAGWIDTMDFDFPGEISLTAEIVCCNNPVPTEMSSWGDIKAMFR